MCKAQHVLQVIQSTVIFPPNCSFQFLNCKTSRFEPGLISIFWQVSMFTALVFHVSCKGVLVGDVGCDAEHLLCQALKVSCNECRIVYPKSPKQHGNLIESGLRKILQIVEDLHLIYNYGHLMKSTVKQN